MKKIIIILALLLIIPMNVYGTPASKTLVESESLKYLEMLNIEGLNHYIDVNGNKKLLNYYVYMDPFYGNVVVFGNPQDIEDLPLYSESTMREEYRYLGYNRYGVPVTNTHYPNIAGGINPKEWKVTANDIFVNDIKAKKAWGNLYKISPALYEFNRKAPLMGNGIEYSENWSARDFDGKNDDDIKVMLLTSAGLYTGITIKVEHTENGQTRYGTFIGEPIDNKRIDSLKVNDYLITQNEIDSKVQVPKDIMQDSTTLTMYGDKDYIDVDIKIDSKIEVDNPLYDPKIIESYKVKLKSYSIDGIEKSINVTSGHNGNSGSSIVHNLKLNRNELKVNTNYIKLQWEIELKTKTEKVTNIEYVSTFIVLVEESNKPPVAQITVPSQVYIGDTINITGSGSDIETSSDKLEYDWNGDINTLSNQYPNIGGTHTFTAEGTYNVSLTVIDEMLASDTVSKSITVKNRDRALVDLNADINPSSYIYTDNNSVVDIKINAEGSILDKKGKTISSTELIVQELQKDYKEGDSINPISTQSVNGTVESLSNEFTFNVDTEGNEYTQYFQVTYKVVFTDGTREEEIKLLSSKLSKKETVAPSCMVVAMPNPVKAGDIINLSGSASDLDGKIVYEGLSFSKEEFNTIFDYGGFAEGWYSWDKDKDLGKTEKNYTIKYFAVDDDGEGARAKDTVTVLPPTIEADIKVSGTLKENRKVILDGKILSNIPEFYQPTTIEWQVIAVGGGADSSSLRYEGSLNGNLVKEVLFSKSGQYKISLYLKNEAGFESRAEKIITIEPDLPPIADLTVPEYNISDPNDDNYSKIPATDMSSSPDGDEIVRRIWFFCFDFNNNGDPYDDQWYVHTNNEWKPINDYGIDSAHDLDKIDINKLSYDNNKSVIMRVQPVGHYYVALWVFEEFGQPTIESLVTPEDRRNGHNFDD